MTQETAQLSVSKLRAELVNAAIFACSALAEKNPGVAPSFRVTALDDNSVSFQLSSEKFSLRHYLLTLTSPDGSKINFKRFNEAGELTAFDNVDVAFIECLRLSVPSTLTAYLNTVWVTKQPTHTGVATLQ